jgi:vacuolar protein sorting-associated protein 72
MKLIQECPRICTSSMTILNDQWNEFLDENDQLESLPERYSRTFVSFTHIPTYHETFAELNSSNLQHRRLCPITGLPAQYFDPLTQMPYATLEAFKILRRIYTEEMKKQKRTSSVLIDAQRDVNLNALR